LQRVGLPQNQTQIKPLWLNNKNPTRPLSLSLSIFSSLCSLSFSHAPAWRYFRRSSFSGLRDLIAAQLIRVTRTRRCSTIRNWREKYKKVQLTSFLYSIDAQIFTCCIGFVGNWKCVKNAKYIHTEYYTPQKTLILYG